jgi:ABC-type multidrug transport system fused ATPase/permease subunit
MFGEQIYITSQDYNVWGVEYKLEEVPRYMTMNVILVCAIAVGLGLALFLRFYSFGVLALRLTFRMRQRVYGSILQKHIGFFDEDEHSTEKLCAILENDVEILNGAGIESIGPILEGLFGILAGIGFALYEERDFFLYCIPAYPVLIASSYMMWRYQKGLVISSEKYMEAAHEFSTEMIINYQTSQSFGYVDKLVD